ncbi:uncharacterized protein [Typha latifolia]|uniref:uncharacterized protein n=1 Tax=Typha latifolia TaxID=4733 RepID=UPI003C30A965
MVGRSKSGCFRILACAGGGDVDDEEGKATSDKKSHSCWKRSTKSQVLSNSAIAEPVSVNPNKGISDDTRCNVCSPKSSSSLENLLEQEEKPTGKILLPASEVDSTETYISVDYGGSIPIDQNHPNKDLSAVTTDNVCSPKCSSPAEKLLEKDKPNETILLSPAKVDSEATFIPINDGSSTQIDENHHETATVVIQSYVRRYLARREHQKLRSAMKMQAIVRGYLVRREAIGTFRCMLAIMKMQALVRARQSHQSVENLAAQEDKVKENSYSEPRKTYGSTEKLLLNGFARQIMETMPRTKSIHVKCDPSKSDSAWRWLERWMTLTSSDMGQWQEQCHNACYQGHDESNKLADNHGVDDVPDISLSSISKLTNGELVMPAVNEGTLTNKSSRLEFQASVHVTDNFSSSSVETRQEINLPENEAASVKQDDLSKSDDITEITLAQNDSQTDTTTEPLLDSNNKSEPYSQNLMQTLDLASCEQLETEKENIYSGKSCEVAMSTVNEGIFTTKISTWDSQASTSSSSVETRQELNLPEKDDASGIQEDPSKTDGITECTSASFPDQNDMQSDTTTESILSSINKSEPDSHNLMHASDLASCEQLETEGEIIHSGKSCEIILSTMNEGTFMTESSRLGFQASVFPTDSSSSSSVETRQEKYLPENEGANLMQDDPSKNEAITERTSASSTGENDLQTGATIESILDHANKSESHSDNLMHASDLASCEQPETEEKETLSGKSYDQDDMSQSLFEELSTNSTISRPIKFDCQDDKNQATILTNLPSEEDASKKINGINPSEISMSDDLPVHNVASKCGTEIALSSTLDQPNRHENEDGNIAIQTEVSEKAGYEVNSDGDIDIDLLNMHVGAKSSSSNLEVQQLQRLEKDEGRVVDAVHVDKQQDETTMLSMHTQMKSLTDPQIRLSPEGTPKGQATVSESHGTPLTQISENAKGDETNNSGPSKRQRSHKLSKKLWSSPSNDLGENSIENIPKDPKNIKRRSSFGMAKPDRVDHEYKMSDSSTLPSYMQATQSARAKAHASNSLNLAPDVYDNLEKRRHSLPTGNGKHGSSPRMLRSRSQAQQSPKERRWVI